MDALCTVVEQKQTIRFDGAVHELRSRAARGAHRVLILHFGLKRAAWLPQLQLHIRHSRAATPQRHGGGWSPSTHAGYSAHRTLAILGCPLDLLAVDAIVQHELIGTRLPSA